MTALNSEMDQGQIQGNKNHYRLCLDWSRMSEHAHVMVMGMLLNNVGRRVCVEIH